MDSFIWGIRRFLNHTIPRLLGGEGLDELLFQAVTDGDLEEVKHLHKIGADITAQDNQAAIFAGGFGNLHILQWLHENGADITAQNNEAAIKAAEYGYLEILRWLHENGADITAQNNEAAIKAAEYGYLEILQWLHENGADITAQNNQALIDAAKSGHLDILQWLHKNGADITDQNNRAMTLVASRGHLDWMFGNIGVHLDCVFYLFEKGAPITGINNTEITVAHGAIEAAIATFLKENNLQPSEDTRSLFYAAAYSLYETTEPNKLGEAVRRRVDKTREEIKLDPKHHSADVTPSPTTVMEKIGFAYPKLDNAADAVDAYLETVLLAQWMLNSGQKAEDIDYAEFEEKIEELRPVATEILYGNLGLQGILRYSDAWHNHPLPDDMRPLLTGQWHPLIAPQTSPYTMIVDGVEQSITITPLCSHAALKDEGDKFNPLKLGHCVGETKYAPKCMEGKIHILSVRAGEKSLATLEIELDPNNPKKLKVLQFLGRKNQPPPEEARQAWNWFENEQAVSRITLNPTPENGWGETEESKRLNTNHPIIQCIGYIPTDERVADCHKHYTDGFKVRKDSIKSERDECSGLGATRHKHTFQRHYVAPGGKTIQEVSQMIR